MPYILLTRAARPEIAYADPCFDREGGAVSYVDIDAAGRSAVSASFEAQTHELVATAQSPSRALRAALAEALTAVARRDFTPVIVRDSAWDRKGVTRFARLAREAGYQVMFLSPRGFAHSPSDTVPTVRKVPEKAYRARVQEWSRYRRVIVIGDVQGCATALTALLDKVGYDHASGDHLVYLGDLFDRGVENPGVYRTVAAQPEADILLGNHDLAIRRVAAGDRSTGLGQARTSIRQMAAERIYAGHASALFDRSDLFLAADFDGQELWFSHGGVLSPGSPGHDSRGRFYRIAERPGDYFIRGARDQARAVKGSSDYTSDYDRALSAAEPSIWHFHGHRSRGDAPDAHGNVWNLETRVEFDGGTLTGAVISRDDVGTPCVHLVSVPNLVTCGPETRHVSNVSSAP